MRRATTSAADQHARHAGSTANPARDLAPRSHRSESVRPPGPRRTRRLNHPAPLPFAPRAGAASAPARSRRLSCSGTRVASAFIAVGASGSLADSRGRSAHSGGRRVRRCGPSGPCRNGGARRPRRIARRGWRVWDARQPRLPGAHLGGSLRTDSESGVCGHRWCSAFVDGVDDLGVIDAAQVDTGAAADPRHCPRRSASPR
jgi:hypothetical protein